MPSYKYKAINKEGKTISGILDTMNDEELYSRLKGQGLNLLSYQLKEKASGRKMKPRVLADFNRSLGMLLKAGVSLVRALSIISQEESTDKKHKLVYEAVLKSIRQGTPLSAAMEDQGAVFPPLMIYMYKSAEASGNMDNVALRLADHYEKEFRLRAKVSGAMVYPSILGVMIVIVVFFIFTFVIPQFSDMFAQMDELPLPTRVIMAISDAFTIHWPLLLIGLLCIVCVAVILLRFERVRFLKDKFKLKAPVFGKLLRVLYSARFSRTLSSLYSAGLPMISALQISKDTVGNLYIEQQFDTVISMIRQGKNLSEALESVDGFVKKLTSSIMIGEETGSLDQMLDATADTLDYESQMAIQKMTSFMEPAMIIIMAFIVGFIMVSVLMPIYGSYEAIGGSAY